MDKIKGYNTIGTIPPRNPNTSQGWAKAEGDTPYTIPTNDWFNDITNEVRETIVVQGLTPDENDNTQLSQAMTATAVGASIGPLSASTLHTRAVIASKGGRISGWGVIIGSVDGEVQAGRGSILGATDGEISPSGHRGAILGGLGGKVSAESAVVLGGNNNHSQGPLSFTLGGENNKAQWNNNGVVGGDGNIVAGANSILLGGLNNSCNGGYSVVVGGKYNQIDQNGDSCAVIASGLSAVGDHTNSAVIASTLSSVDEDRAVVMASRNCQATEEYAVQGGWSRGSAPQNPKWILHSKTGNLDLAGTANNNSLDYAEMWEVNGAIPVGLLVSWDAATELAEPASPGSPIIGVTSASPGVLGGNPHEWAHKYVRDDFGGIIRDANGEPELNPEYDPTKKYIRRIDRPEEWACVGMLGRVYVRVDKTVSPGDWVVSGGEGIGTKAIQNKPELAGCQVRALKITKPGIALCHVR